MHFPYLYLQLCISQFWSGAIRPHHHCFVVGIKSFNSFKKLLALELPGLIQCNEYSTSTQSIKKDQVRKYEYKGRCKKVTPRLLLHYQSKNTVTSLEIIYLKMSLSFLLFIYLLSSYPSSFSCSNSKAEESADLTINISIRLKVPFDPHVFSPLS